MRMWQNLPKPKKLFEREARTLKMLHHPGIPKYYDFSWKQVNLAMELVHGQDLEKRVVNMGPVTPRQSDRVDAPDV